jgi:transposase
LNDAEWTFFEAFVIERGPKRGSPPSDHRRALEGISWIARKGSPWRDLPDEFGKWSSVYRQFIRWSRAGTADILFEASAETEAIFRCASNDSIRPLCGRTTTQMAERGDLEKHSWPFVRWLLDQNSPPHKRRRPANWHHDHGG